MLDAPDGQRCAVRPAVSRAAGAGDTLSVAARPPIRRRSGSAPPEGEFAAVTHRLPMLSLNNAFTPAKSRPSTGACARRSASSGRVRGRAQVRRPRDQPRLRGRRFAVGATRGDGYTGEDVTANLRTVRALPLTPAGQPPALSRGARRGADAAARLRRRSMPHSPPPGEKIFVNPRNAAAGACASSIRGSPPGGRWHFSPMASGGRMGRQSRRRERTMPAEWLSGLHFPVAADARSCRVSMACSTTTAASASGAATLPFEIDGVVYKVNDFAAAGAARVRVARPALGGRAQVCRRGDAHRSARHRASRSGAPAH